MRWNPTVSLAIVATTLSVGSQVLWSLVPPLPKYVIALLVVVQFLCFLAAYTIIHDATHRAASRMHLLNELMLIGAGFAFLSDGFLFRRVHLIHHAHTHREQDPDRFTSAHTFLGRLLRSASIIVGYYCYAVRQLWSHPKWRRHLMLSISIALGVPLVFALLGRLEMFLILWLLPLFLAQTVLGLLIASLPHDYENDRMFNLRLPRILCWVVGNGNMHLAHHKFPRVPWYELPRFWQEHLRQHSPRSI